MATIKDVALAAGVSVGTVSNMLNGKCTVGDDKHRRIQKAIEALNYHPNYMARNLKYPSSKIVGILLPSLDEPYSDIYKGIVDLLDMGGYVTVLKLTQNNTVLENNFLTQLAEIGAVGIVIVPSNLDEPDGYMALEKQGISVIMLERKFKNADFTYVLFENKTQVFGIASAILAEKKTPSLRLYVGKQEFSCERDCVEGFLEALPQGAADIVEIREINKEAMFNAVYQSLAGLQKRPDAVIASSLQMAELLQEAGNLLGCSMAIHAIVGENWHTTNLYQNIVLHGRNAILMGKTAARRMESALDNKYLTENQTIYLESKKNYKAPEVQICVPAGQTLRVLTFKCATTTALKQIAYSFTEHSGIRLEFDELSYRSLKKKLVEEFESGSSEYDIYMMDLPWLKSVLSNNYLADFSAQAKADNLLSRYPDSVRASFSRNDRGMHVLPIIATTQVILYRQDVFNDPAVKAQFLKRYGFALTQPTSWTNFNVIAEFFDRRHNPHSPFENGTAATALEPVGLINEFLPRQWAFHGSIVDRWGKLSIDSEENIRALDNLTTTFSYTPKEAESFFWDEIFEMLVMGKIPMAHGFASHYQPGAYSRAGNTYERYIKAMALPRGKAMLGGWVLGVNRHSAHQKQSYEYIKWNLNDRIAISNMRLCGCTPIWTVFRDETLKGSYEWLNMVSPKVDLGGLREELYDASGNAVDGELVDQILSSGIKKAIHQELGCRQALSEIKAGLANIMR